MHDIIHGDCLKIMKQFPENYIDLILSSPPYNLNIDYIGYKDNLELKDYLIWHEKILIECIRILKNGGRLAWQIGAINNKNYFPLNSWIAVKCIELGLNQRTEIIWNKKQISKRIAWGSWCSPSDNTILPSYEYIELFYKKSKKLLHKGETDLTKKEFISWTNGMWNISPETKNNHPAPFPVEIPKRLIKMNTYINDIVLDPFAGSGTTAIACLETNRDYILIEKEKQYVDIINNRINIYKKRKKKKIL